MSKRQLLACSLLSPLLLACSATPPPQGQPMPFSVALAPLAGAEVLGGQDDGDIQFGFDQHLIAQLNAALAAALDGSCFIDARALPVSPPLPAAPPADLDVYLEAAHQAGADVLLTFRLRHDSTADEEINPFLHTAAPFSWLPGPQVWAVPDRIYLTNCTLSVFAFDVSRHQQFAGNHNQVVRRWYFTHTAALDEIYSNYFERAGWNVHYYLPGLIIPTMFLDLEKDSFPRELMEEAVEDLAATVARDLQNRRVDLIRNEHDYGFFLDEDRVQVEVLEEDQARVTFSLIHKQGLAPNEPRSIQFATTGTALQSIEEELDFEAIEAAHAAGGRLNGYNRYDFSRLVRISPGSRQLKLRVSVGSSPRVWRSYSLRLPATD